MDSTKGNVFLNKSIFQEYRYNIYYGRRVCGICIRLKMGTVQWNLFVGSLLIQRDSFPYFLKQGTVQISVELY